MFVDRSDVAHGRRVALLWAARLAAREHALQRILECFPEVAVEVRVDQWIQRRVEVTDPEQHGDQSLRETARIPA